MKIKDLIAELRKFPADALVIDYEGNEILKVEFDETYSDEYGDEETVILK